MMASNCKDTLIAKLNWDYAKDWMKVLGASIGVMVTGFALYCAIIAARARLHENRLKADKNELRDADDQNKIQDAPPKVRALPDDLRGEPVMVDDHICTTCKRHRACIIFLPCKHCFLCENCYKETPTKMTCSKCNG